MSSAAHEALTTATTGADLIHIPSIGLVERTYLGEKGRLPSAAREALIEALDDPAGPCVLVPFDRLVAEALQLEVNPLVNDLRGYSFAARHLLPFPRRTRRDPNLPHSSIEFCAAGRQGT